ncbi:hypothetical protein AM493_17580 [Flavobacterium akiainvivens]|uniref:DUF2723 domain-containing protein n=1 Tax=Flavobacterium akiainvivens TaxID=1202724 RepID=A0A0M8MJS9_9FLAO|nr:DUF2723 domain-containing protein [Flavobacterium akiainvivens]KOS07651.1 hypothetical protein AM493_17580 [Flavobacterium akiainvivens]SFQ23554.1 Protein of unknown function [Flavobacterium akiainvivens]
MITFNFKKWDTILAWAVFFIALLTYTYTADPSVSFWDCGEYISTSAKLQIGHPPGAPLFQIIGAFFAAFATSKQNIGFMVNMVSVLSSAFTIFFMFRSTTLLLRKLASKSATNLTNHNAIAILGSATVATLAYTFSDSFWFNATETEVYAAASLIISVLVWLGLRWEQEMRTARGNRWLLLIAFITGLSFGVHFMALLALPSVGFIYYFKHFKRVTVLNFIVANIVIVAIVMFIFLFLLPFTMGALAYAEIFAVNRLGLPFNTGTIGIFTTIVTSFIVTLWFTKKKGWVMLNTVLLCMMFVLIGFCSWAMVPIRSNAGTSINENRPDNAAEVLAYYNREHYGEQKLFYGPMYTKTYAGADKENPYRDEKINYERNYTKGWYDTVNTNFKNAEVNSSRSQFGFMPRMWSNVPNHIYNYMVFTQPPAYTINDKYDYHDELISRGFDPDSTDVATLNTEKTKLKAETATAVEEFNVGYHSGKYGFKEYDKFLHQYGNYLNIEPPSFGQNMSFMFEFQFGYMYWRYLMWNFSGRQNDINGHYDSMDGNWLSGINALDNPRMISQENLPPDLKDAKGRNIYYMLPFFFGIAGLIYHFYKDWKNAYVVLMLFLFTGLALKIYLNERAFEPRERDYALVGSFYAFAIWIGFGTYWLYTLVSRFIKPKASLVIVLTAALLACPVLMAKENWDDHNRHNRYSALAIARMYLDSCEPNAILFTQADNDTFPLWYLQEIEGYRTDVRIVNTLFLSADWYIDQMKTRQYNSAPLPISYGHDQYKQGSRERLFYGHNSNKRMNLEDFIAYTKRDDDTVKIELKNGHRVNTYPTVRIRFEVDKDVVIKNKVISESQYENIVQNISMTLPKSAVFKNRLIMLDIIANNNWERPICFTGGVYNKDEYAWMQDYLQLDGYVYKLVPVKTTFPESGGDIGGIDSNKMYNTVTKWYWGNSNNPDIYLDPETLRNFRVVRKNMARLANKLLDEGKKQKAEKIIDLAVTELTFPNYGAYHLMNPFAEGYYRVGATKKAQQLAEKTAQKYSEALAYYVSLPVHERNEISSRVIQDLQSFKALLAILKEHDKALHAGLAKNFNTFNAQLPSFGIENEL